MTHAQTLTLDDIHAASRDIQQEIDEMILEQIGFVDVEKSAIGLGQQAGLEAFSPLESARSRLSAPTTRSSVAPSGRSTTGTGCKADLRAPHCTAAQAEHRLAGDDGSQ